jgi:hypothetical protein
VVGEVRYPRGRFHKLDDVQIRPLRLMIAAVCCASRAAVIHKCSADGNQDSQDHSQ